MENKSVETKAENAWGYKLAVPVTYKVDYSAYQTIEEVKAANDLLKDDEVIRVRNAERLATARQKALAEALKAANYIKPNLENDEQVQLKEMLKVLMSGKKYKNDEAGAKLVASQQLGIEWANESGTLYPKAVEEVAQADSTEPVSETPSEPVSETPAQVEEVSGSRRRR